MQQMYEDNNRDYGFNRSASNNGGGFGNFRERNNLYNSQMVDPDFGSMMSNGYFGSGSGNNRDSGPTSGNSKVQHFSTSTGSGGSAENSAGYEDDFPELATAKFNNLSLNDASPAGSDLNSNTKNPPFVAF